MISTSRDLAPLVDELLFDPPRNRDDFERRTSGVDDDRLLDTLLRQLRQGRVDVLDARAVGRFVDWLDERGARRLREFLDGSVGEGEPHPSGVAGFVALERADDADEGTLGLEEAKYVELAAAAHDTLMQLVAGSPELVEDIGRRIRRVSGEARIELLEALEESRRESGVPAGLLYRPLLESEANRPFAPRLAEMVREAGEAGDRRWLERLATAVDSSDFASQLREAADALPEVGETPEGRAFYGSPDGTGAAPLFVFVDGGDGRYTGHHLVLRHADSTIGDGYTLSNVIDEEIDQMTEDFEQEHPTRLTEIDLGVGVRMAQNLFDETSQPIRELDPETRSAVYRLDRIPAGESELPAIGSDEDAFDEQEGAEAVVREAFDEAGWLDSWFFSVETLERVGASKPDPDADAEELRAWRRRTVEHVAADDALGRRVERTARAAARWFALDGDRRRAVAFAELADGVRESPDESVLVDLMVEASLDAVRDLRARAERVAERRLGDETVRSRLRRLHLDETDEREEPLLDLMELAHATLDEIRGEPSPGEDEPDFVSSLAGPLGEKLADYFIEKSADERRERRVLEADLADLLQERGVGPRIAEFVVPDLVEEAALLARYRRS